jgi:hypothetical protein
LGLGVGTRGLAGMEIVVEGYGRHCGWFPMGIDCWGSYNSGTEGFLGVAVEGIGNCAWTSSRVRYRPSTRVVRWGFRSVRGKKGVC